MPNDSAKEIRERTFAFGCRVARLALSLAPRPGIRALVDQLLRAGTAVGANLEEAKAALQEAELDDVDHKVYTRDIQGRD